MKLISSFFILLLAVSNVWAGQSITNYELRITNELQLNHNDSPLYHNRITAVSRQGITVTGTVKDHTGDVLPGVNIVVDGSAHGVVSDVGGRYSIIVPDENAVLVFSSVGCVTQEIIVGDQTVIDVTMTEDSQQLDEVVVVGYGTQKRKELTGSVASVSKSVLEHPTVSLDAMLGGAVAGVNVTHTSGQPGASSSVRIRGGNSVTASNDPLYVIDGFIFYSDAAATKAGLNAIESSLNPLAAINPSDIESIEVLKDVSATAIYGSRGANGVILVTTKKGTRGVSNVSYQYTLGWDKPAKKLDLLNAQQWARMEKDFFYNKGKYTDEEIAQLGEGYDWQDAVLQTGVSQTHELSVSGGNDNLRYSVSGNYTDQNGIVLNSGFKRYNGRVNIDKNITDKLTVGVTATVGKSTQNSLTTFQEVDYGSSPYSGGIANSLTYALYIPPVVPIYENGDYNYHNPYEYGYLVYNGVTANPVSDLRNSTGQTINTTILGNFYARYNIIDGLVAKVSAGAYVSHITQNFFAPSYSAIGLATAGLGGIGNKRQEVKQMEYTLAYTKQINENHFIDALAGYTYQETHNKFVINMTSEFTNETLGVDNLGDGAKPFPPISNASNAKLNSWIGRVNYSLLGRYNVTATIRGDKSSHFAKNHRWGYFPSVGVSWNVNDESFFAGAKNVVPLLKLRLTYGTVGNQEIGEYEYAQMFKASQYNGGVVYRQTNLGNSDLKWETTTSSNAGVDVGLFNNRLSFVADVYHKKTDDLLVEIPIDPAYGVVGNRQLVNVGNVTNRGIEFAVNAVAVERKDLRWTISANIARNINKISDMGSQKPIVLGSNRDEILKVGESLGSFYGLQFNGIVQTGEDVSLLPTTPFGTAQPGDVKIADVGGQNGAPDGAISDLDRTVLGSIQPDFTYGLQTTLDYRGFDLFISFQGSQGNKVYNYLRRYLESPNDSYNASAALLDSWTVDNPSNIHPGLYNLSHNRQNGTMDSRYIEDASFLRLKNITLGYTVKPRFVPAQLRVFASVQNLLTLANYKGYDPEVARGIDLGTYPTARTFSVGARITF
ncbi:SusC/RagA family TonB-linked outer membrane protein [Bacteroidia bacterium]|nr:SusC/RagA family TonB-linked outer membrane protein [Bacteroidia bacterium]